MAKDYSDLIGKRFHSLTILSISEPMREERSQRLCECLCSCGQIKYIEQGYQRSSGAKISPVDTLKAKQELEKKITLLKSKCRRKHIKPEHLRISP